MLHEPYLVLYVSEFKVNLSLTYFHAIYTEIKEKSNPLNNKNQNKKDLFFYKIRKVIKWKEFC